MAEESSEEYTPVLTDEELYTLVKAEELYPELSSRMLRVQYEEEPNE